MRSEIVNIDSRSLSNTVLLDFQYCLHTFCIYFSVKVFGVTTLSCESEPLHYASNKTKERTLTHARSRTFQARDSMIEYIQRR